MEEGGGGTQVHLRSGFLGEGFAGHEDGEEGEEEGGVLHFWIWFGLLVGMSGSSWVVEMDFLL